MSHIWHMSRRSMLFLAICFSFQAASSTPQSQDQQIAPPQSIPLTSVATSYPLSLNLQDASIQDQIRNTLAHYPAAIDGKNFAALNLVFTADAVANYSAPLNVLNGLQAIETTLKTNLALVLTQHALSTQIIEIETSGLQARSVTYFTASQFGTGAKAGKV